MPAKNRALVCSPIVWKENFAADTTLPAALERLTARQGVQFRIDEESFQAAGAPPPHQLESG